jgi:multiple sugar transport system permease protein
MKKHKALSTIKRKNIWALIIIWVFVLIIISPFILTLDASFQDSKNLNVGDVKLIPIEVTLQNYSDLLLADEGTMAFRFNLFNSFKVGIGVCLLSVIISVLGAYSLSHFKFRGKEVISRSMLFLYVFPTILMISPIYGLLADIGLIDNHLGLILVHTTLVTPFCIWLLKGFFDAIPHEVEEAAIIDGASRLSIIRRIIVPLAAPGILTIGIYALIYSWGEYTFASILINRAVNKTIPIALAGYAVQHSFQWGRLLAGVALNFVPLICIFMPLLKSFLKGFTAGAVKQ